MSQMSGFLGVRGGKTVQELLLESFYLFCFFLLTLLSVRLQLSQDTSVAVGWQSGGRVITTDESYFTSDLILVWFS